jgi:hypothetical protein
MSTVASSEALAVEVEVTEDTITARLADGRSITVPLAWSWRLSDASPAERQEYELIGNGQGIRWPKLDEDISVRGMLEGIPARRPSKK